MSFLGFFVCAVPGSVFFTIGITKNTFKQFTQLTTNNKPHIAFLLNNLIDLIDIAQHIEHRILRVQSIQMMLLLPLKTQILSIKRPSESPRLKTHYPINLPLQLLYYLP
jgi:hypothetical protein